MQLCLYRSHQMLTTPAAVPGHTVGRFSSDPLAIGEVQATSRDTGDAAGAKFSL